MYKTKKVVVEDVVIGKNCPKSTHCYTGGKSVLELPVTVSFLDEGKYTVYIDKGRVVVEKVD